MLYHNEIDSNNIVLHSYVEADHVQTGILATCSNVARYAIQACTGFVMHVRKKFTLIYIIRYDCRPPIHVLNTSAGYYVGDLRSYPLSATHLDRVSLIN